MNYINSTPYDLPYSAVIFRDFKDLFLIYCFIMKISLP